MRGDRRRKITYYKRRPVRKKTSGCGGGFLAFLLVLGLAAGIRLSAGGPLYRLRVGLEDLLQDRLDLREAVETLGRSFRLQDAEEAAVVFGRMILGLEEQSEEATQRGAVLPKIPVIDAGNSTMAGDLNRLTFAVAESSRPILEEDLLDLPIEHDAEIDTTPNAPFVIPSPDTVDDALYPVGFQLHKPVSSYRLTSPFGYRIHPISGNTTFHYGVDLAAGTGTKVVSIAEGTVIETGYGSTNGNYIKIEHPDGFRSHYAHLHTIGVKKGEQVKCGQKIGAVGSTGYSTGPHLHFEVRKNGKILDPCDYFDF